MPDLHGNPYHDQHGRFTTGAGAEGVSPRALAQQEAVAAKAGTPESGVPGQGVRPTPPSTPPVFTSADGSTAIHIRDGSIPMHEVWKNGEMIDSARATRAWRTERAALIAQHGGVPPSGADTVNGAIRTATGRGQAAPSAADDTAELHRLLSEEALFTDPTGDAAAHSKKAAALADTWREYGDQYGSDIFQRELARARRAASGRARAMANSPTIRQEIDLTSLIAENRLAENPALNRDTLYRQSRADVTAVSRHGLGKYNEWLARESAVWNQREQGQYGDDIERVSLYHPFEDGNNP